MTIIRFTGLDGPDCYEGRTLTDTPEALPLVPRERAFRWRSDDVIAQAEGYRAQGIPCVIERIE